MEQLLIPLPGMWADHHVLVVRGVLAAIEGVADVDASARDGSVTVSIDPQKTGRDALVTALRDAGYAPGDAGAAASPPTDKPAWTTGGSRTTTTDPVDLTMSGDHRKY